MVILRWFGSKGPIRTRDCGVFQGQPGPEAPPCSERYAPTTAVVTVVAIIIIVSYRYLHPRRSAQESRPLKGDGIWDRLNSCVI